MAAPTFVQFATGSAQSTSVSVSAPSGTLTGDHQLIYLGVPSTSITVTSVPSGWTLERTQQNTNDATPFTLRCYKSSTATGSAAFTVSSSTTLTAVRVTYRGGTGVESSVGSADSGSSTSHVLATAATTVADSLVVAGGYEDSSGTSKTHTMSGWTERADFATSGLTRVGMIAAYDIVKATAGTQGGTIVSSAADLMATISVVLAADAGTIYSKTGGAAGRGAGSGTQSVIPANFVDRTGGGTARSAGSGTRIVTVPHLRSGGAAASSAGSGTKVVTAVPPLPSDVLDLSYWHLTTPEDSGDGTAEQINQPALDSYESSNFFADTVGGKPCVVFRAPVDGFSTSAASGAVRMELRQHRKSGYANAAMDPNGSGRWQMTITTSADPTSVTGGSNPRQELIIAQIHGAGDSPIPLILSAEWTSGGSPVTPRVRIFKNGPGLANIISGITTSTRLTLRIRIDADAGRLKVWGVAGEVTDLPPITASTPYDWPISDFTDQEGWYYKAGAYHKTTITSGSSGVGIAKVTYLNILEPGDPEEVFSVVYEKAGGAAASLVGSGARTLSPAAVHTETGGGAASGAGSGTRTLSPAASHAKTGGAAARSAGTGARALTPATTHSEAGGASARSAGSGAVVRSTATVHVELGGAAAEAGGSGSVELATAARIEKAGGAAAGGAGSGARAISATWVRTGGATTTGAGSGARDITSNSKTGGAAASGAGSGVLQADGGVEHARTGGASTSVAGSGTRATQSATVHVRTGGASTSAAGSGAGGVQSAVVHTRTGGASVAAAGTGLAQFVPAVRHDRTGGASVAGAGAGTDELAFPVVHVKAGGGAAFGAASGARGIASAVVYEKAGGVAPTGAGICLVEVIPAAVYALAGGGALVAAGSGQARVGGRMHASVPRAVGQFRSGTPVRR